MKKKIFIILNYFMVSIIFVACSSENEINQSTEHNNLQNAYFMLTKATNQLQSINLESNINTQTNTKTNKERSELIKSKLLLDDTIDSIYIYVDGKTTLIGIITKDNIQPKNLKHWKDLVKNTDSYIQTVSITTNSYLVTLIKDLEESL